MTHDERIEAVAKALYDLHAPSLGIYEGGKDPWRRYLHDAKTAYTATLQSLLEEIDGIDELDGADAFDRVRAMIDAAIKEAE